MANRLLSIDAKMTLYKKDLEELGVKSTFDLCLKMSKVKRRLDPQFFHLNPIRAKLVKNVKELESYPYSGHGALTGKANPDWQDTEYVLKLFDSSIGAARRSYKAFLSKGVAQRRRPDLVGGGLLRSVGGWFELKNFAIVESGSKAMNAYWALLILLNVS